MKKITNESLGAVYIYTGSLKENKKKNIKGITLVELVVTIIILLILAGISISVLTQTGLFGKANKSVNKSNYAYAYEKINLAILNSYGQRGVLEKELLRDNINKIEGLLEPISSIETKTEITVDGYVFEIDEQGTITYIGKQENTPQKTELVISTIDKDTNINTDINLNRKLVVKRNTINCLKLNGVENQTITILNKTNNIELKEKNIIVNEKAGVGDSCIIKVTGKYNSQNYTNTIEIYVDFSGRVKVTDLEGKQFEAYPIYSSDEFYRFIKYINDNITDIKNAKLMNDIDLSNICSDSKGNWLPIHDFSGIFDGNNCEIKNIYIKDTNSSSQALFLHNKGIIKNLYLSGSINVASWSAGIVVNNQGIIYQCCNSTTITSTGWHIGGIATINSGGIIRECFNNGTLKANGQLASGIVDVVENNGIVENCYNTSKVEVGEAGAAGIIGYGNPGNSTKRTMVKNCYNRGTSNSKRISGSIVANDEQHATTRMNNYWLTGVGYSTGCDRYDGNIGTTELNYQEMKNITKSLGDKYIDDIHNINDGYPILKWQLVRYNKINGTNYQT